MSEKKKTCNKRENQRSLFDLGFSKKVKLTPVLDGSGSTGNEDDTADKAPEIENGSVRETGMEALMMEHGDVEMEEREAHDSDPGSEDDNDMELLTDEEEDLIETQVEDFESEMFENKMEPLTEENDGQMADKMETPKAEDVNEMETLMEDEVEMEDNKVAQDSAPVSKVRKEAPSPMCVSDIGALVGKPLSDQEKYLILKEPWKPPPSYQFKFHKIGNKNRAFQRSYLETFPWLSYSRTLDAAFCRMCFIFQKACLGGEGKSQNSLLVTKGFNNWKLATTYFRTHSSTKYHKESTKSAESFLMSFETGVDKVTKMAQKKQTEQAENNQRVLIKLFRAILFLTRQNIPLRGHRDSGKIVLTEGVQNDGNYRALLRYTALHYDEDLKTFLETSKNNATYTSAEIQNQVIQIIGNLILRDKVRKINSSECFSIIADESTDISTKEQLSICIRYLVKEEGQYNLREDFIGFTVVTDLSGNSLAREILENLGKLGIDLKHLRGQSYDGASAMSSNLVGVKTRIQQDYPLAVYTYCANHCLNLVVSSACKNTYIRNMIGTVKEVVSFFSRSAKRTHALNETIRETNPEETARGLKKFCETRWVERLESIFRFSKFFDAILLTLEKLEDDQTTDAKTKAKASSLMKSICTVEFLLSMNSAVRLFSFTKTVAKSLQDPKADLQKCYDQKFLIQNTLLSTKENSKDEFHKIFIKTREQCEKHDVEVITPRIRKPKRHFDDPQSKQGSKKQPLDPETFFKEKVFLPFLQEFIDALASRFENHNSNLCGILKLLPTNLSNCTTETLIDLHEFYKIDLCKSFDLFEAEVTLWKSKWNAKESSTFPQTSLEVLNNCDETFFPNVHKLLKILSVLPISIASAERTFSCLRRIKSYLRSTMTEERLSALALIAMHYDVLVILEEVMLEFKRSNRRILLP